MLEKNNSLEFGSITMQGPTTDVNQLRDRNFACSPSTFLLGKNLNGAIAQKRLEYKNIEQKSMDPLIPYLTVAKKMLQTTSRGEIRKIIIGPTITIFFQHWKGGMRVSLIRCGILEKTLVIVVRRLIKLVKSVINVHGFSFLKFGSFWRTEQD